MDKASSQIAESQPAVLEIGPEAALFTLDKAEDIGSPDLVLLARNLVDAARARPSSISGGFLSVAFGSIGAQTLNNEGSGTVLGEPLHGDVAGGASRWFALQPEEDGTMLIDTIGSEIDTLLAVYRYTNNPAYFYSLLEAHDDNSAPDGIRSLLRFPAQAAVPYMVVVDGVNGQEGPVKLNWRLGVPPRLQPGLPPYISVTQGDGLTLRAEVEEAVRFQWLANGEEIRGATNETLVIGSTGGADGGEYSVIAENDFGLLTKVVAHLRVEIPLMTFNTGTDNGSLSFSLSGPPGKTFEIQVTEDLETWQHFRTVTLDDQPYEIEISDLATHLARYFVAVPAPETGRVVSPDAEVGGRTQAEWSAEWWKWAMSTPANQHPLLDETGEWAGRNQPGGEVFFLAGLNTVSGRAKRSITIPEGQYLFFPGLNAYCDNTGVPPPGYSIEELRECGILQVALTGELHASLNGIGVPNLAAYRQISPVFSYVLESPDNWLSYLAGFPVVGLIDPAVADGFYLLVQPLPPGIHTLNFGGTFSGQFGFSIDITYTITVVSTSLE
jgi:hypothetical protein